MEQFVKDADKKIRDFNNLVQGMMRNKIISDHPELKQKITELFTTPKDPNPTDFLNKRLFEVCWQNPTLKLSDIQEALRGAKITYFLFIHEDTTNLNAYRLQEDKVTTLKMPLRIFMMYRPIFEGFATNDEQWMDYRTKTFAQLKQKLNPNCLNYSLCLQMLDRSGFDVQPNKDFEEAILKAIKEKRPIVVQDQRLYDGIKCTLEKNPILKKQFEDSGLTFSMFES
jgi:hypothetical protein